MSVTDDLLTLLREPIFDLAVSNARLQADHVAVEEIVRAGVNVRVVEPVKVDYEVSRGCPRCGGQTIQLAGDPSSAVCTAGCTWRAS